MWTKLEQRAVGGHDTFRALIVKEESNFKLNFVARTGVLSSQDVETIEGDVCRSYWNSAITGSQSEENKFVEQLKRLTLDFFLYHPDAHYIQGFNFIAAVAMIRLESDSILLLHRLWRFGHFNLAFNRIHSPFEKTGLFILAMIGSENIEVASMIHRHNLTNVIFVTYYIPLFMSSFTISTEAFAFLEFIAMRPPYAVLYACASLVLLNSEVIIESYKSDVTTFMMTMQDLIRLTTADSLIRATEALLQKRPFCSFLSPEEYIVTVLGVDCDASDKEHEYPYHRLLSTIADRAISMKQSPNHGIETGKSWSSDSYAPKSGHILEMKSSNSVHDPLVFKGLLCVSLVAVIVALLVMWWKHPLERKEERDTGGGVVQDTEVDVGVDSTVFASDGRVKAVNRASTGSEDTLPNGMSNCTMENV